MRQVVVVIPAHAGVGLKPTEFVFEVFCDPRARGGRPKQQAASGGQPW